MDLGLGSPEAQQALQVSLDTIAAIDDRVSRFLPGNPVDLGQPGSDIASLMEVLPDPPVDIRITMLAAVSSSRSCLTQIRRFVVDEIPTSPEVLATLCRTALMAACRLIFIVGPQDEEARRINATQILRQESDSLQRCYSKTSNFTQLAGLIPPADVLEQQDRRHQHLKSTTRRVTESDLLEQAAQIVGALLRSKGYDDGAAQPVLAEHLVWIFNIYSGVAHGFGWPRLVPGTASLPGDFTADLWMTACAVQVAIDQLKKAHQAPA